jgi:hypothetical protein
MNSPIHLHAYCPRHEYLFMSDGGTNPQWIDATKSTDAKIKKQFDIEKEYGLPVRPCMVCADELVAWRTQAMKAVTS